MAVYKNKQGEKLYPVCSWEKNQHKLYNAHDRIFLAICDARDAQNYEELEELYALQDKIERAISVFDGYVINGIVYATYQDGLIIKDFVWAYDARH